MQSEMLVSATKLRRTFYDKKTDSTTVALDALSLNIPPCEMTAIIGPDGARKTTFMRLICGLLAPHARELKC